MYKRPTKQTFKCSAKAADLYSFIIICLYEKINKVVKFERFPVKKKEKMRRVQKSPTPWNRAQKQLPRNPLKGTVIGVFGFKRFDTVFLQVIPDISVLCYFDS